MATRCTLSSSRVFHDKHDSSAPNCASTNIQTLPQIPYGAKSGPVKQIPKIVTTQPTHVVRVMLKIYIKPYLYLMSFMCLFSLLACLSHHKPSHDEQVSRPTSRRMYLSTDNTMVVLALFHSGQPQIQAQNIDNTYNVSVITTNYQRYDKTE